MAMLSYLMTIRQQTARGRQVPVSIERPSFQVWEYHVKDETVVGQSYI